MYYMARISAHCLTSGVFSVSGFPSGMLRLSARLTKDPLLKIPEDRA